MSGSINTKPISGFVQENGIIRLENGKFIGRLDSGLNFDNFDKGPTWRNLVGKYLKRISGGLYLVGITDGINEANPILISLENGNRYSDNMPILDSYFENWGESSNFKLVDVKIEEV